MTDNTKPLNAIEYDTKINLTIPYYTEFYKQTIDVVKNMDHKSINWLDTPVYLLKAIDQLLSR